MFQLQFTRNGETQTLGYATLMAASQAAEDVLKFPDTSVATVIDATDPENPIVAMSWSRG